MAREINSHGVKYVGIYIRELPWKLTTLPLRLSGSDRKRELAGISLGSARFDPSEVFVEIFDLTDKRESLSRGAQMADTSILRSSIYTVNFRSVNSK